MKTETVQKHHNNIATLLTALRNRVDEATAAFAADGCTASFHERMAAVKAAVTATNKAARIFTTAMGKAVAPTPVTVAPSPDTAADSAPVSSAD